MRASQGIPHGPKARPYHPELFHDHEEVIVYELEEFRRNFTGMKGYIRDIFLMYLQLDNDNDYRVQGQWSKIMDRIHIINLELDSFFSERLVQCCLDTYLHEKIRANETGLTESLINESIESMTLDWL
ncbi:hypothetical protein [Methanobacterium formicicum]|uniref:Uncharacterized protein n=1 Tax=Methanobacterium formicicum TaxID=2162 RepID=A0A0S4FLU6_METFO|nr:hypothetical protein [Methanobacterium formicicum]CEL24005.1 hypothetical protein MB9_0357 [Methanobacterium formicicum]